MYPAGTNTSPSVASLLSGRLPQGHRLRRFYQLMSDDIEIIPAGLPLWLARNARVSSETGAIDPTKCRLTPP